jgi:DNA-binding transcriptional MerR regulator
MEQAEKRYYTIGEVADQFGVSKSLIRFWDQEFEMLRPHKNSKGERRFTPENIRLLKQIHGLVKERGFTLKGAQQELYRIRAWESEKVSVVAELREVREFLVNLVEGTEENQEEV